MPQLATKKDCTGCSACKQVCPKHCISMGEDAVGVVLPSIDTSLCIECKACERACPALNAPEFKSPRSSFAAWATDKEIRRISASGGIASAIYKYVADNDGFSIGAVTDDEFRVKIKSFTLQDQDAIRNSKYTFSDAQEIYHMLRPAVKAGDLVVLIGLPCQTAGYRKYLGDHDNVIYIDLICHGVTPNSYLRQHIKSLETQLNIDAHRLSFRAPEKGTANYYFTLYGKDRDILYSKRSADGEKYNLAFHRSYSYRENCYHCHYARRERCSDITIGDYHGLGEMAPCDFSDENVSVILVNTSKGEAFVKRLADSGLIEIHCRPTDEPIKGDLQLQRPSPKTCERIDFEKYIEKYGGDFETAIDKVLLLKARRERITFFRQLPRRIIRKILKMLK
ncbi:Coenzyme F420 hydrogenase/dehydrogenase, beta subunit C-terminal domain [Bacteroides acidifaciens]|uniref:Coenzyme F420 hydrogenase/dehydrogenase, beta subunit C-terminal domain n=1 Tax=Bacteroides acidifaciens TaxID=85831 RepID=UPI0025A65512|nr:Coenzyme F420 hydrogenase/dehydrogenase, beta subunit C-terminal domain [Bacteroides acidifaciens]